MGLVEVIREHRISITDTSIPAVLDSLGWSQGMPYSIPKDSMLSSLRGRIAEQMAYQWLEGCPGVAFDTSFPRIVNGYSLFRSDAGIEVCEMGTMSDKKRHSYDNIIMYDGKVYLIEVKSMHLNGVEGKFDRALEMGKDIYGQEVGMLVFFPYYTNKQNAAADLEKRWPEVRCIDLGYKKKHLQMMADIAFHALSDIPRQDVA